MNGIKFSSYNAGHVLGAAMFMLEIAGVKVLYTGDFSCEEDRHLMAAEIPPISPDVLISVTPHHFDLTVALCIVSRKLRLAHMSMSLEKLGKHGLLVCGCLDWLD